MKEHPCHEGDAVFATIDREAEFEAFEPRTFMAQRDKVVVLGYEKVRSKRTSRTYENHWVHEFTLAGGKIVEYCDTAAVAAAFATRRQSNQTESAARVMTRPPLSSS